MEGACYTRKGKTLKWLTHARESPAGLSPTFHSACYQIWQNVQEVEREIPSYTTNIHDVSTKFGLRAVVIFLAARRLAIENRVLPSTIPKKNNNCSRSRQNYLRE